jgi:DNA repair protein RecN (Recombination protein N)
VLQKLFIQNYAIIDELAIGFPGKLNVITGETGAGKSIIVGALGLILGERADSSVLVNKEKKCIVEGQFSSVDNKQVAAFFKENDIDGGDEILIRREITTNGKSRAFINDTPVNLSQLEALTSLLVDLHHQFDAMDVGASGFQREVLDALASQQQKVEEYTTLYYEWNNIEKEIEILKAQQQQFEKETDYNRFQFRELEEAGFRENELEEAEASLKVLTHAEEIKTVLSKIYFDLKESETPVVPQLKTLLNQLSHFTSFHQDLPAIYERLQSVQVELNDIADETSRISDHIHSDMQKLNELNERLSLGYKLQKKHGVQTTAELLAVQQELGKKLDGVIHTGEIIIEKEKQSAELLQKLKQAALKISEKRKKQVAPLEKSVNELLARVGMPNARLQVKIEPAEPGLYGMDKIEFLFNANTTGKKENNGGFQPVRKVASGGELSRLMLCIKSLVAASVDLPTMIFDEIDTGISGEAAKQVGIIMKELAANRQVICITHQPQIAGKADAHYYVYKEIAGDKIKTGIRSLSKEERITAIAKMLSGEKPSAAALENARELVMG